VKPADLAAVMVATNLPEGTLRRWIANGWVTKLNDRPCMVDLDQVYLVQAQIGKGRNRARKTHRGGT
jgi:hypothetical protein